jgi:fructokinase
MKFKTVGIGEVLWDLLPSGSQLGGAPANFAYHTHALGASARVITRVGDDDFGRAIRQRFEEQGIADGTVQTDSMVPTGTVTVSLAGNGIPNYVIHEDVAWDEIQITPMALNAVEEADAICFGSLAQRREPSRATIQKLVAAASPNALRVFDINLRQKYFSGEIIEQSLRLANVLKLNDSELPILAKIFSLTGSIREQISQLAMKFDLQLIALTRGPAGSLLFQDGRWSDCPSVPIEVVDTVGAGDAFAAILVLGLLHKMELDDINALADEVARYVCSCTGATPELPKKFSELFAADNVTNKKQFNSVAALKA